MVIQLEDINITATIVEIILLTLMAHGTTAKPNPNISVEECVSNETYFFKYVPKSRGSTIKSETFESRNQNKTM